jgi:hypothetical protein
VAFSEDAEAGERTQIANGVLYYIPLHHDLRHGRSHDLPNLQDGEKMN